MNVCANPLIQTGFLLLVISCRPLPAIASGSGSPLPSLGEGLGVRARLLSFTGIRSLETPFSLQFLVLFRSS
ncbi:hypothetical protein C7B77_01025 [Chamaesiphon polymorphus CCALA 037]|uniref:Uncharacterized protein n=1 Tax=Chamaesiphon polymorphus CCALA 037 TaxID=2107692 RepID=A0A2T1GNL9_9CYAN|nr:hypothetical protein C7B77_01025 [Chamaesiphon polymorphus CCALA 037]